MARSSSVINVSIIGDAKKLIGAVGDADTATGGLLKSAGKVLVAGAVVRKGFDIIGDSLANADRFGDALDRIAGTTNQAFADHIKDISDDMANIGLSAPEVADMAAGFADFATAAKVSEPLIETLTPKMIDLAAAISQTTGKPLDEVISDIGKAAAGNQKSVSDYGIVVDKSLNPDERLTDILQQLTDKFPDVASATGDYAGKQDALNAKWDNATTKLGILVQGPLTDVLTFINDEIDAIPSAIAGWGMLGDAVTGFAAEVLTPLARVADALRLIIDLFSKGDRAFQVSQGRTPRNSSISDRALADAVRRENERNGRNSLG